MSEYGELQKALAMVNETLDQLRVKLEPVLGQSTPKANGTAGDDAKSPVVSPLAESIRSDCRNVYQIRSQLMDLIDRIEL